MHETRLFKINEQFIANHIIIHLLLDMQILVILSIFLQRAHQCGTIILIVVNLMLILGSVTVLVSPVCLCKVYT